MTKYWFICVKFYKHLSFVSSASRCWSSSVISSVGATCSPCMSIAQQQITPDHTPAQMLWSGIQQIYTCYSLRSHAFLFLSNVLFWNTEIVESRCTFRGTEKRIFNVIENVLLQPELTPTSQHLYVSVNTLVIQSYVSCYQYCNKAIHQTIATIGVL